MSAGNTSIPRFALDPSSAADLRLKLKQDPQAGLKEAAQQFETMVLQIVLKGMRDTVPQDGLLDSDQTRFFTGILDQQLAQNLATKGGLGFAKMIEEQLGRNLAAMDASGAGAALGKLRQAFDASQAANYAESLAGLARRAGSAGEATGDSGGGEFVNRVWPYAMEAAKNLGVPPHFLVAQAALESGWGRSEIRRADGATTYNVFGIKAGRSWSGDTVAVPTTEYVDGVAQTVRERFRAYASYDEAFRDYADLLRSNPRFSGVLGQQDGTQFARSLQQAGYATDPAYADKLVRIIGGTVLRQALAG